MALPVVTSVTLVLPRYRPAGHRGGSRHAALAQLEAARAAPRPEEQQPTGGGWLEC